MDFLRCGRATTRYFFPMFESKVNQELLEDLQLSSNSPSKFQNLQAAIRNLLTRPEQWFYYNLPFQLKEHPCIDRFDVEFIGSTGEGLSLTERSECGLNEELDLTAVLSSIKAFQSGCHMNGQTWVELEYSEEHSGYVFLKLHIKDHSEDWCGLCNIMSNKDGSINDFYLSPVAFTDEFYMMLGIRCGFENMQYINHCKNIVDGEENDKVQSNNTENDCIFFLVNQEGPAVKTTCIIEKELSLQYDCSLAIHCTTWPTVANEFKTRHRLYGFPAHDLVVQLTSKGCLIVPKYPDTSKIMLEWRLSFCLIERELMLNLTDYQRKCYILFKAIWRNFLCPPIGKIVQSYHLKNIFLWECEHVPIKDWREDVLVVRVMGLLQRLQFNLLTGYCPHYIMPVNNLFTGIDKGLLFHTGMRVHTCIFQSKVLWIDNDALLTLPPHKTRTSLGRHLQDTCITALKNVIEAMVRSATKSDHIEIDQTKLWCLDKESLVSLKSNLEKSFRKYRAGLIFEYIKSSLNKCPNNSVRDYICSRANPKQLLIAADVVPGIAAIVNAVMSWGDMVEVITGLEIIETENLKQYGLSDETTTLLELYFLHRMGVNRFNKTDEEDEESSLDGDELMELSFICDECEGDITGIRYHCKTCDDFDLCESCFPVVKHPHEMTTEELDNDQCTTS